MTTFRGYLMDGLLPDWAKYEHGGRLCYGAFGVIAEGLADQQTRACCAGMLASPHSPDDALPLAGRERGDLPRYPGETAAQYRLRLIDAYNAWGFGGADQSIVSQLDLAGFPGAQIAYYANRVGPRGEPAPYLSQFWVTFPDGSLNLVPAVWGQMVYGCFWWGRGALSIDDASRFWSIVRKFKPVNYVCRGIELV
jgi:hypothetical protein